jgi:hypothetical protein
VKTRQISVHEISRWCPVFRVAGVVGWDHGSAALAGGECPAVVGLEVVVVVAEAVEVVEAGAVGVGPAGSVVVL